MGRARTKKKLLICLLFFFSGELCYVQAARISELAEADLECKDGICQLGSIAVETNRMSKELLRKKDNININTNVKTHTTKPKPVSKSMEKMIRLILRPFFTARKFIFNSLASFFQVSGGCIRSIGFIILRVSEACDSAFTAVFQIVPPILTVNIL